MCVIFQPFFLSTFRVISVNSAFGIYTAFIDSHGSVISDIIFRHGQQQYTIYRNYLNKISTTIHILNRDFVLIVENSGFSCQGFPTAMTPPHGHLQILQIPQTVAKY